MKSVIMSLFASLVSTSALASESARTDSSGVLVWFFLGFCALIIAMQTIPGLLMMFGFIKGISKDSSTSEITIK